MIDSNELLDFIKSIAGKKDCIPSYEFWAKAKKDLEDVKGWSHNDIIFALKWLGKNGKIRIGQNFEIYLRS